LSEHEIATTTAIDRESGRLDSALTDALFTPIGIAGDDDLDAPDLAAQIQPRVKGHAAARSATPALVAKQTCLLCGSQPGDPHHLRFAQARETRIKDQ
jgi:hypothetical protein